MISPYMMIVGEGYRKHKISADQTCIHEEFYKNHKKRVLPYHTPLVQGTGDVNLIVSQS